MKKLIIATAAIMVMSSGAFAQNLSQSNLNTDGYWLYNNGGQGINAYAQAYTSSRVHHITTKSIGKRAATGQKSKM